MLIALILVLALSLTVLVRLHVLRVRPWLLHWGAGRNLIDTSLPGDALIPHPLGSSTRTIDINAPVDAVFPWLVQMGHGRAGFYSYDGLENLLGLDIHSADHIVPEWQSVRPGDVIALAPVSSLPLRVARMEEDHYLLLRTTELRSGGPVPAGDFFREEIDGTWLFFVRPLGSRRTRLIVRWRATWRPSLWAALAYLLFEPIHFVMERRMLLGIRQRVEAQSRPPCPVVYFPLVPRRRPLPLW